MPRPQVTLLCPTKDRLRCLKRKLEFISYYNENIIFIIIDSSSNCSAKEIVNSYILKLSGSQISLKYEHNPCDSSNFFVWQCKIATTLKNVCTEFVVIDSDDDFLDLKFIIDSTEKMLNDKSISAVNGIIQDFNSMNTQNANNLLLIQVNNDGLHCSNRYISNLTVRNSRSEERLKNLANIWPSEGVIRTSVLKAAIQISIRLLIDNYLGFLFILRYVILMKGSYLQEDSRIFTFRQDNTPNSSGAQITVKEKTKYEYFLTNQRIQALNDPSSHQIIEKAMKRNGMQEEGLISYTLALASSVLYKRLLFDLENNNAQLDVFVSNKNLIIDPTFEVNLRKVIHW